MKHGLAGLQNGGRGGVGGGGGLQLIMPENITNEMVMKSNGKWFGRLVEEEEKDEENLGSNGVHDRISY